MLLFWIFEPLLKHFLSYEVVNILHRFIGGPFLLMLVVFLDLNLTIAFTPVYWTEC